MKLLIATSNPGKLNEILEVIGSLNLNVLSLKDLGVSSQVEENGKSYKENAKIKAEHFHKETALPTLAEDSGIVVEALADQLGIHTRRWGAGEKATDEEWIAHFLNEMQQHKNRKAKFISHLYYIDQNQHKHFLGETHGEITMDLQAPIYKGLPLSSCFIPEGQNRVYAALGKQQKNQVSHRGKAVQQFHNFLKSNING